MAPGAPKPSRGLGLVQFMISVSLDQTTNTDNTQGTGRTFALPGSICALCVICVRFWVWRGPPLAPARDQIHHVERLRDLDCEGLSSGTDEGRVARRPRPIIAAVARLHEQVFVDAKADA